VVFRSEAVQRRLLRLDHVIHELEELAALGRPTLRQNHRDMLALERLLQLGAEILFDIGNHILSTRFGLAPGDYGEIVRQLSSQGVLSSDLHDRLGGMAGFRNILVHDYMDLDPERVLDALERAPLDFSAFALEVRRWLEGKT
jgi:uncharacterized protein YutE (UPF0331/DUF86 family)